MIRSLLVDILCCYGSLMLAVLLGSAGVYEQPQEKRPDGFGNCQWGIARTDSLTTVLGLAPSSKNDGVMHRYTATKLTKYGKAIDVVIYFYFYKDQLSAVVLRTTRIDNAVAVLEDINKTYGKGVRPSSGNTVSTYSGLDMVEHYAWAFSGTFIEHDFDINSYATFTIFKSQRLDAIQFEDKATERKKEYEGKQ